MVILLQLDRLKLMGKWLSSFDDGAVTATLGRFGNGFCCSIAETACSCPSDMCL